MRCDTYVKPTEAGMHTYVCVYVSVWTMYMYVINVNISEFQYNLRFLSFKQNYSFIVENLGEFSF